MESSFFITPPELQIIVGKPLLCLPEGLMEELITELNWSKIKSMWCNIFFNSITNPLSSDTTPELPSLQQGIRVSSQSQRITQRKFHLTRQQLKDVSFFFFASFSCSKFITHPTQLHRLLYDGCLPNLTHLDITPSKIPFDWALLSSRLNNMTKLTHLRLLGDIFSSSSSMISLNHTKAPPTNENTIIDSNVINIPQFKLTIPSLRELDVTFADFNPYTVKVFTSCTSFSSLNTITGLFTGLKRDTITSTECVQMILDWVDHCVEQYDEDININQKESTKSSLTSCSLSGNNWPYPPSFYHMIAQSSLLAHITTLDLVYDKNNPSYLTHLEGLILCIKSPLLENNLNLHTFHMISRGGLTTSEQRPLFDALSTAQWTKRITTLNLEKSQWCSPDGNDEVGHDGDQNKELFQWARQEKSFEEKLQPEKTLDDFDQSRSNEQYPTQEHSPSFPPDQLQTYQSLTAMMNNFPSLVTLLTPSVISPNALYYLLHLPTPLKSLRTLLNCNHLYSDYHTYAITTSSSLSHLQTLNIPHSNHTSPFTMYHIGKSPYLSSLTSLVGSCFPGVNCNVAYFAALINSPNVAKIKSLNFGGSSLPLKSLVALTTSPWLQNLQHLDLSFHRINTNDPTTSWIEHLFTNSIIPNSLTELSLRDCNLTDHHLYLLSQCRGLTKLRSLQLSLNTQITDQGIKYLVDSPYLNNLDCLGLGALGQNVTGKSLKMLFDYGGSLFYPFDHDQFSPRNQPTVVMTKGHFTMGIRGHKRIHISATNSIAEDDYKIYSKLFRDEWCIELSR